jgi:hypothetical protein
MVSPLIWILEDNYTKWEKRCVEWSCLRISIVIFFYNTSKNPSTECCCDEISVVLGLDWGIPCIKKISETLLSWE